MNPLMLLGWQRYALYAVVALSIAGVVWFHGYTRGEIKLFEYQAAQAKAAVPIIVKQGATTERIVVQYRDRKAKVETVYQTIEKEIVRYVPPAADVVLPVGWGLLHDRAAVGAVPPPPEGVDVAAPGIAASQALKGVVGNYGTCHGNALQLAALQAWLRAQYQVMNLEPLGY